MAQAFPKLKLKQFAPIQERESQESKFWKNFSITHEEKFPSSPNCVDFCSAIAGYYLITGSTRVSMYDRATDKVQKSFSRFSDDAYSGKFRKDGKLIVAGDKAGAVKVFDVQSKAMLRQVKRHTAAVRSTCWSSDGLAMLSGSDDRSVKRWDLATSEVVWESSSSSGHGGRSSGSGSGSSSTSSSSSSSSSCSRDFGHADYVRTVDANPVSPHVFASGCYDHAVRLWDSRQPYRVLEMLHGKPVEHVLMTSSGAVLLSAGGNEIKTWDLIAGRLMHTFCNHQKNITSLCMDGSGSRILSAGLDGHVKVYSLQTMLQTHGMRFGAPLSCVGVSPDNTKLVVGFVDGTVNVRTRRKDGPSGMGLGLDMSDSSGAAAAVTAGRFYRGAGAAAERAEDGMVEAEKTTRLRPYEAQLKKFNYQQALDAGLKTRNPLVIVTVLEELSRRNGLTIALSGRDESSLEPLLSFASKFVTNSRYSKLIIRVAHHILDMYASVLGRSDAIDELFLKLHKQVKGELDFQREIMPVKGILDGIIASSTLPR